MTSSPPPLTAPSGFLLGSHLVDGGPVASRTGCNVIALGPSQTGKTSSGLAHAVQRCVVTGTRCTQKVAPGAIVTSSTKTDLLALPQHGNGRHLLLDLVSGQIDPDVIPEGVTLTRFSPLKLVRTVEDALLVGRTLMETASSMGSTGVRNEVFFTHTGGRLASAQMDAAATAGAGMREVYQRIAARDAHSGLQALSGREGSSTRAILQGHADDAATGEDASSIFAFADLALSLYAFESAVARADAADFDVEAFVRSDDTLHIVCPGNWALELGPVIAVLLQAIADARYRLHAREPWRPPLTMVLDEVANTAPLPQLAQLCSIGGMGVRLFLGGQDRAQLEARWGAEKARTIISNCRDRLVLPELGDRPWLEDVEALCGIRREDETSSTETEGAERSRGRTSSQRDVPLWRVSEIAQLPPFHALYLRGWTPSVLKLRHWSVRQG